MRNEDGAAYNRGYGIYSIFLRLCYCLLVYGKVLLYGDWKEDLFYHAANVVPMAVMAGCFIMLQVYKAAVPEWEVDYAGIFVAWTVTFLITECFYYMKRSRREILKAESAKKA